MTEILSQEPSPPDTAHARILLAHGAGAPMDSKFMNEISDMLVCLGLSVYRFEFSYMDERRRTGKRRPPPRVEKLLPEYHAAISHLNDTTSSNLPLYIGGKSMGGRIASMVADQAKSEAQVAGLVCLGYPFHPAGKPEKLRTSHLEDLQLPTLIVQGDRDALGNQTEVAGYTLSPAIKLHWESDGDHDLKPRRASGCTHQENMKNAAQAICQFAQNEN